MSKYSILCLGDSYTIGEQVRQDQSWPYQVQKLLRTFDIEITPTVLAQTGWTCDDLLDAIYLNPALAQQDYDFVFLLIGVNNQYRNYPFSWFERDLNQIAATIHTGFRIPAERTTLITIPDYGYFPAIPSENAPTVHEELRTYNEYLKFYAKQNKYDYIDITEFCALAKKDPSYVAQDLLHPSGKMYLKWAEKMIKSHPFRPLIEKHSVTYE